MAIAQQASRFALLQIDDDIDSDEDSAPKDKQQNAKGNKQQQANKKKNKKKAKKDQNKQETAQLQNLAFGGSAPGKRGGSGQQNGHHVAPNHRGRGGGDVTDQQWDEWKRLDSEQTTETYERDLQQALLLSKLEQEEQKKNAATDPSKGSGGTQTSSSNESNKNKKKKKKKDKPASMSLDQFNQMPAVRSQSQEDEDGPEYEVLPAAPKPNVSLPKDTEPDKAYFDKVDQDVQKILRQEQIQEEYRKQYAMGTALSAQYQHEVEKRDQEIAQLKKDNKGLTEELQQVKKRNQQLCHILAQGEMKDKASVQEELEQLQVAHQELTEQVTELTEELERERSRGHSLKAELDKLKGGKHGSK